MWFSKTGHSGFFRKRSAKRDFVSIFIFFENKNKRQDLKAIPNTIGLWMDKEGQAKSMWQREGCSFVTCGHHIKVFFISCFVCGLNKFQNIVKS